MWYGLLFGVILNPLVWVVVYWIYDRTPASIVDAKRRWGRRGDRTAGRSQLGHARATSPAQLGATLDRYGDHHQSERAKYAALIRMYGGICMERECIMGSRRINAGSYWELAHDHTRGGDADYLGPAHRQCNQAEALSRGVTWAGAPTLAELLESVGRGPGSPPAVR